MSTDQNMEEQRLNMAIKAEQARLTYLRQLAQHFNLPLNADWNEAQIRAEFRRCGIPQSGFKADGSKTMYPNRSMHAAASSPIISHKIEKGVEYHAGSQVGKIDHNIPFVTRSQRDKARTARKPKVDPMLAIVQKGDSFQVEGLWSKSVAMVWSARAKKYRQAHGLQVHDFDVRTGPCPRNPKHSRVWRIA